MHQKKELPKLNQKLQKKLKKHLKKSQKKTQKLERKLHLKKDKHRRVVMQEIKSQLLKQDKKQEKLLFNKRPKKKKMLIHIKLHQIKLRLKLKNKETLQLIITITNEEELLQKQEILENTSATHWCNIEVNQKAHLHHHQRLLNQLQRRSYQVKEIKLKRKILQETQKKHLKKDSMQNKLLILQLNQELMQLKLPLRQPNYKDRKKAIMLRKIKTQLMKLLKMLQI